MAGRLQLAREQVRVERLCVRIIERLVPTGQEVVDLMKAGDLSGVLRRADLLAGYEPSRLIDWEEAEDS